MKITKFKITFERDITPPDAPEPEIETIELNRSAEKLWYVESTHVSRRGLFPNEIRIANELQELINKFNINQKSG